VLKLQSKHTLADEFDEYLPAWHGVHVSGLPTAYVPDGQASHVNEIEFFLKPLSQLQEQSSTPTNLDAAV
jgi:hypothetical protein